MDEVVASYDFPKKVTTPVSELVGLSGQQPTRGIMTIKQMAEFVEARQFGVLFKLYGKQSPHPAIEDAELRIIDAMLDDRIINQLLAPEGYTPASRDLFPYNLFRAEILKTIKYPEISYRKFCGDDKRYKNHKETSSYIEMESKQNRAFIGLALNRKQMIDHVQMSQFRSSLAYRQMVNLNVYILYLLKSQGLLEPHKIHCFDCTTEQHKVALPSNVEADTLQVTCNDLCEIAMDYIGSDPQGHEFKCGAKPGQCTMEMACPRYRCIPFDGGCFQPVPHAVTGVAKAIELRKNGERPFNLIKKREGLEYSRVRGQHNILVKSIFTTVTTLLIEMAGTRKSPKPKRQQQLELLAAV